MGRVSQVHTNARRAVEEPVAQGSLPLIEREKEIECEGRPISKEYAIQRAMECHSFGSAIEACATAAGIDLDKAISTTLKFDPAQLSRWQSGAEGIKWHKLEKILKLCGNPIPIYWLVLQAGFDPHSMQELESEVVRRSRLDRERLEREGEEKDARIRELETKFNAVLEFARARAA